MAVEKLKAAGHLPELEEIADPAADFAIDAFAHGPLSIMLEEFRSRLLEEAANIAGIAGKRCIEANDLEQAYERLLLDVISLARTKDPVLYSQLMGFPEDLPDLARKRPPGGNSRPNGISKSWRSRRVRNELPETY
jgi:histone H3/H4